MKRTLMVLAISLLLVGMCAGIFSNAAEVSTDPSDVYEVQTAPYEDESISMWFEHSFKKVMTSDTTPSDMDTYSVYMGKNEIENAQFVLYSDETKTKLRATVSDFTNADGDTVDASIYYQMYVTLSNLDTLGFWGATEENTFIRNGEQPDPVVPLSAVSVFQLNAGKSQAFYIRLETTEDSTPGWYSAQLDIKNSKGQIIKTATVYAYVWDFTIDDKSPLQTSFYLGNKTDQYGTYDDYYNYLLENKMNAMDIPGGLYANNPYLTDDRVNSIRVATGGGGYVNSYMDSSTAVYSYYADIYNNLSSMKEWEDIKDKFYFYTVDEAMSDEQQQSIVDHYAALGQTVIKGKTVDDVIKASEALEKYWKDAAKVVPYHENHPYPYNVYNNQTMATLETALLKDGVQAMIDSESVNLWCPQIYAFTPLEDLQAYGYTGRNGDGGIRSLSASISGSIKAGENYFNWEKVFGEFRDRAISSNIVRNEEGAANNQLWTYSAGWNKSYSYCNHLIENSGLQTKMLFWQLYQNDITGYLYYGTNNWTEYKYDDDGDGTFEPAVNVTTTGSRTGKWQTNEHRYDNGDGTYHAIYGNGTLFYTATQGTFTSGTKYVGSIRIDMIRDGIEEYQMLTMLEELEGDSAADEIVGSVSTSVVEYLSMPNFSTSAWSGDMDEYDIMAEVRIRLGNALETAYDKVCEHEYDEGKVTKEATCLEMGEITYTCTKCGAEDIQNTPALHTEGSCYEITTITAASCTSAGKYLYECTICDYSKYVDVKAYHSNPDYIKYVPHSTMTSVHSLVCTECGSEIKTENHYYLAEYTNTCTEAGVHNDVCKFCGYTKYVEDVEAHGHYLDETVVEATCQSEGYNRSFCHLCDYSVEETYAQLEHNYVDGVCTMCGASTVKAGDVDGDGDISMLDLYKLKLFLKQTAEPTEAEILAADIDGDGDITMLDSYALRYRVATGVWK